MEKIQFQDMVAQYPARYRLNPVEGQDGVYDIESVRGNITREGTPLRAFEFNRMQENIEQAIPTVERGTWVPVVEKGTATGVQYTARYTKQGSLVSVSLAWGCDSFVIDSSGSEYFQVSGLPYAPNSMTLCSIRLALQSSSTINLTGTSLYGFIGNGSKAMVPCFQTEKSYSPWSTILIRHIGFSAVYLTDQATTMALPVSATMSGEGVTEITRHMGAYASEKLEVIGENTSVTSK